MKLRIGMHVLQCMVLSSLSIGAAQAFIIPPDFEPERIRPQNKIAMPAIQTVPEAVDFLFESGGREHNPGPTYSVVHVRIPKAAYFVKDAPSGPFRSYGTHFTMFYPDFSGLGDSKNSVCSPEGKMASGQFGWCKDEMTVSLGYTRRSFESVEYGLLLSGLANGYLIPLQETVTYPGLELVGGDDIATSNRFYETRRKYYLSRNLVSGKPEFVIQCSEYVRSPNCETHIGSIRSPHIRIGIIFAAPLMPKWKDVIERTRDKVDSMIVKTYELTDEEGM